MKQQGTRPGLVEAAAGDALDSAGGAPSRSGPVPSALCCSAPSASVCRRQQRLIRGRRLRRRPECLRNASLLSPPSCCSNLMCVLPRLCCLCSPHCFLHLHATRHPPNTHPCKMHHVCTAQPMSKAENAREEGRQIGRQEKRWCGHGPVLERHANCCDRRVLPQICAAARRRCRAAEEGRRPHERGSLQGPPAGLSLGGAQAAGRQRRQGARECCCCCTPGGGTCSRSSST